MEPVPLGPLAAFDIQENRHVVFDENRNKLILQEVKGTAVEIAIPREYTSEFYYWARIHFIFRDVILTLLKSHSNKVYYLVSFKMDSEAKVAHKLRHVKTNIYSTGYHIQSHIAGTQLVFSINNVPKKDKWARNEISDRELFKRQISGASSQPTSPVASSAAVVNSTKSQDDPDQSKLIREGVLMVVKCLPSGEISGTVVSLGKQRLGVKLRRVGSIRRWKDTLGIKSMTKWDCEDDETFCEPVLSGGRALLINRSDPSLCSLLDTVTNPRYGIAAAVQEKINHGLKMTTAPFEPIRSNVAGLPPDVSHLWSNVEVLEGIPLIITVASNTGFCLLFQLHQMAGPRLFWKRQEVSFSIAGPSLKQVFLRANRNRENGLCELTVRGLVSSGDSTKSFVETIQIRL